MALRKFQANDLVWVREGEDELSSLDLGRVLGDGERSDSYLVQILSGVDQEQLTLPSSMLRNAAAIPDHTKSDLLQLEEFSEEGIVHSLHRRFGEDKIYT